MEWKLPTLAPGALSRYILGALAIAAALLYLRYAPDSLKPWTNAPGPVTIAESAEEAKWVEPEFVPGPPRLKVYPKAKLSEKLDMPELKLLPGDVVATADIPPSSGTTTAVATLDNGVGGIVYKQKPAPFFALQKEFGVRAGFGTGGLVLGELYARPARVGPVTVEIRGFAQRTDRSGADFGGAVLADYRF